MESVRERGHRRFESKIYFELQNLMRFWKQWIELQKRFLSSFINILRVRPINRQQRRNKQVLNFSFMVLAVFVKAILEFFTTTSY
jgi:hypothetical protein